MFPGAKYLVMVYRFPSTRRRVPITSGTATPPGQLLIAKGRDPVFVEQQERLADHPDPYPKRLKRGSNLRCAIPFPLARFLTLGLDYLEVLL
jgi:hypothetical protein